MDLQNHRFKQSIQTPKEFMQKKSGGIIIACRFLHLIPLTKRKMEEILLAYGLPKVTIKL